MHIFLMCQFFVLYSWVPQQIINTQHYYIVILHHTQIAHLEFSLEWIEFNMFFIRSILEFIRFSSEVVLKITLAYSDRLPFQNLATFCFTMYSCIHYITISSWILLLFALIYFKFGGMEGGGWVQSRANCFL